MKILMAILAFTVSASAFAGTYEDREAEIQARKHQNETSQMQTGYIRSNRNYLRRMATLASRHRGLATAVTCKSLEAEYNSQGDSTASMVIEVPGLSATISYTERDLKNWYGVTHEPQITACSLEFRDGLACTTWTRDAVHHDEVGYAGVVASCVSPSLKESSIDLGSIL